MLELLLSPNRPKYAVLTSSVTKELSGYAEFYLFSEPLETILLAIPLTSELEVAALRCYCCLTLIKFLNLSASTAMLFLPIMFMHDLQWLPNLFALKVY